MAISLLPINSKGKEFDSLNLSNWYLALYWCDLQFFISLSHLLSLALSLPRYLSVSLSLSLSPSLSHFPSPKHSISPSLIQTHTRLIHVLETLVYGSEDGGGSVVNKNPHFDEMMRHTATSLHLRSHRVHNLKGDEVRWTNFILFYFIFFCYFHTLCRSKASLSTLPSMSKGILASVCFCEREGDRKGLSIEFRVWFPFQDGRFYLLDLGRAMPSDPIRRNKNWFQVRIFPFLGINHRNSNTKLGRG